MNKQLNEWIKIKNNEGLDEEAKNIIITILLTIIIVLIWQHQRLADRYTMQLRENEIVLAANQEMIDSIRTQLIAFQTVLNSYGEQDRIIKGMRK